jgi:predicted secreted protein
MGCTLFAGKNMLLKINNTNVAKITSLTITTNSEPLDASNIDSDWVQFCEGLKSWTANAAGFLLPSDAGQNLLMSKALSGGQFQDIQFYEQSDGFRWEPDVTLDANAGMVLESFEWTGEYNGLLTFTASFLGSGPPRRTDSSSSSSTSSSTSSSSST